MSMMLRQSTAVTIKFGPFVDEDDGKTAETGLTISQADIRLSKNGGNMAQTNNAAGATHDELGFYDVPLDTTDTNTLGSLLVAVHESGALPVFQYFMVLPANVYDSIVSGSDYLDVSLVQWLGTAPLALSSQRVQTAVGAMASGVITVTTLTAALRELLAYETLSYTTAECEGAGTPDFETLYGMICALTHKHERDATDGNIVIYKSDGSTALVTIPITKDQNLQPIKSMTPP